MSKNNVVELAGRDTIIDLLTELLRTGAEQLIYQAVEAELRELLAGAILGAVVGLSALGSRVNIPDHGWWIKPMILTAVPAGVMHLAPLPLPLAGALSIFLLTALTWMVGVFSRAELRRIAGRFKVAPPHSL